MPRDSSAARCLRKIHRCRELGFRDAPVTLQNAEYLQIYPIETQRFKRLELHFE
jgi:hypothetical protein